MWKWWDFLVLLHHIWKAQTAPVLKSRVVNASGQMTDGLVIFLRRSRMIHDMYILLKSYRPAASNKSRYVHSKKRWSSRGFGERIVILCRSYVKGIIHQGDHLRLSLLNICWICLFLGSSPLMPMNMCRSLTICTESMISFLVRTSEKALGGEWRSFPV